jgi:hypothetical protein
MELEPISRGSFLADACGDDVDLLRDVEGLLAESGSDGALLRNPVLVYLHQFDLVT